LRSTHAPWNGRLPTDLAAWSHRYRGEPFFIASSARQAEGVIAYRFHARDLHLVMGTSVRFRVLIDGRSPDAAHGIDVDEQGDGIVTEQGLYQLIKQPKPVADRQFEIEFLDPGVEAFSFTFG
jgi:hypothetical protein